MGVGLLRLLAFWSPFVARNTATKSGEVSFRAILIYAVSWRGFPLKAYFTELYELYDSPTSLRRAWVLHLTYLFTESELFILREISWDRNETKEENIDLNTKISAFQLDTSHTCLEWELFPWEICGNDWQVLPVANFTNTT